MRFSLTGLILIATQLFTGCNSCDCDKGYGLEGFYTCSRTETTNQEFLWLLKNKHYVHILLYDTVAYVNSDNWHIRKDEYSKKSLFIAENWVAPCETGRAYCYQRIDYVAKHNFKDYMGGNAQLEFGCYIGIDDTCYFRLLDQLEPMYNYKRIADENHKMDLKGKRIEFYTERDSVVFSDIVKERNILK